MGAGFARLSSMLVLGATGIASTPHVYTEHMRLSPFLPRMATLFVRRLSPTLQSDVTSLKLTGAPIGVCSRP